MILDDIVAVKKERLIEQKAEISLEQMIEMAKTSVSMMRLEKKDFPLLENLRRHLRVMER